MVRKEKLCLRLLDDLFFESRGSFPRQKLRVHRQTSSHWKTPAVSHLANVVQINFRDKKAFFSSGESRSSGCIRSPDIA